MEPTVTITIGTTDIATTLLQQYVERQNEAARLLRAERKLLYNKLDNIYELKQKLIREAYEEKLPTIQKLVACLKKLIGKEYKKLEASLDTSAHGVVSEFYGYLSYRSVPYEKKTWAGTFSLFLKGSEDEEPDEVLIELTQEIKITVKVPDGIREQVNEVFSEIRENSAKINEIEDELKNPSELQRKVTARLTEQMLSDRPELQAQLATALGAMSVKLLE